MEFSFKMRVTSSPERIWDYYSDIQKWYVWEDDLEDITLNGNFETGTTGMMKLANMPPLDYTLIEVTEQKSFCDKTPTPFGDVYFNHQILEESGSVFIQHSVKLDTGEENVENLGFLRQIFSDVPDSIMMLKKAVEE